MSQLVVEIHVPLVEQDGVGDDGDSFPWIWEIDEALAAHELAGGVEVYDDSEEYGDHYVYFLTGAPEPDLLAVASGVAVMVGVPAGAFAVVTTDDAGEFGVGRRVPLPVPGVTPPTLTVPADADRPVPAGGTDLRQTMEVLIRQFRSGTDQGRD